ncbi:hypothetical protein Lal_00038494 [Lupinus albus]|uniref:Putative double-stranded RNA-binding domain-containing protein n=1 Tax=Lupinus albus TaxID=3870 RepID=A0A6A5NJN2_LUPAL|nr:putative double-stranded RNA-binding domain-containing protein [Lupinus albus]KAF1881855.1 hypothetical protein Lal_00038494 [Lupinus albus]
MDSATNTNPKVTNIDGSTKNMSEIDIHGPTRDFLQIYLAHEDVPSSSSHPIPQPQPQPQPQLPLTSVAEVQHSLSSTEPSAAAVATTIHHMPEHTLYKNRLQEFTQKSSIPLPMYQTVNEGTQHVPRFRSTVWVDGKSYTNQVSFLNRKAAEQDAARLALESLPVVIKDEASPLVLENTMFSKSIMNEYATKLNVAMPTYSTAQIIGMLPVFVSTLVFNDTKYTGDASRNKKEAEQLAARRAILSILGDPGSETLFEIVKSKSRITATIKPIITSQVIDATNLSATVANSGHASHSLDLNIRVAGSEQPVGEVQSSRKRRKNKKKVNKKARLEAPLPVADAFPAKEMPPCSVAQ